MTLASDTGSLMASKHSRHVLTLSRPELSCSAMQLVTRAGCGGRRLRVWTEAIIRATQASGFIMELKS